MWLVTDGIKTEVIEGDFYFNVFLTIGVQCKTTFQCSPRNN